MPKPLRTRVSAEVRASFEAIAKALPALRAELKNNSQVAAVRPGYYYPPHAKPMPAAVVAVFPETGFVKVDVAALAHKFGVPVSVTDASLDEQVAALAAAKQATGSAAESAPAASISPLESLLSSDTTEAGEAAKVNPPRVGTYKPIDPPDLPFLENEQMDVTIAVSPEAGFSQLKPFLAETEKSLTVAMYQFTAPHIFEAVRDAVIPAGRKFELVLHPIPEKPASSGVKKDDLDEVPDVIDPLKAALPGRFDFSWATLWSNKHPDGLWASAYHIKVAVRDSNAVWLSSGNWQSSNQPDFDPFAAPGNVPAGFQRRYNRDYHAIVVNERLAAIYEEYIRRDYQLTAKGEQESAPALPDLFIPAPGATTESAEFHAPPEYTKPLQVSGKIKVQPLLTPDNYAGEIVKLIRSAKKSLRFQNQYINFRNDGQDFEEFQELVGALKDKADELGSDDGDETVGVRIICRDLMSQANLDVLIALGFPREIIRFQPACHNKTIIVDEEVVALGSHNWSNEGVKSNRDASLIFHHDGIAQYLAKVYDYDWKRLATAKPAPDKKRVARDGESAPAGMIRVPYGDVVED